MTKSESALELQSIVKRFGGLVALNALSLEVKWGEVLGLIGPNGAGKTTAFNVITGFYRPEAGRVVLDGKEITGLSPHAVARLGVARTFQIVKPFATLTVEEAVRVGAYRTTNERRQVDDITLACLDLLELTKNKDKLCKDCNLYEMKRTELARALATRPRLLLLDEVAAGLTPSETDQYIGLIKNFAKEQGLTVCVVEHVMRFVMGLSNRLVVMDHGEKIAEGSVEEVGRNPRVLKAYLGEKYVEAVKR